MRGGRRGRGKRRCPRRTWGRTEPYRDWNERGYAVTVAPAPCDTLLLAGVAAVRPAAFVLGLVRHLDFVMLSATWRGHRLIMLGWSLDSPTTRHTSVSIEL